MRMSPLGSINGTATSERIGQPEVGHRSRDRQIFIADPSWTLVPSAEPKWKPVQVSPSLRDRCSWRPGSTKAIALPSIASGYDLQT